MAEPKSAPYGTWKSPLAAIDVASTKGSFDQISISKNAVYWVESRPTENGRQVLVKYVNNAAVDLTPAPFSCRTRVHEYGGASYVLDGETVYFSNFSDNRLYVVKPGEIPTPFTTETRMRYADGILDTKRSRLIFVGEDHETVGAEPTNRLVTVSLSGEVATLIEGNSFYSTPRLSPDGSTLCWLSWDHPNMPWEGTELWTAKINPDGKLGSKTKVAGGTDECIFQPEWSPAGVLHFVSDRSGWGNLYRYRNNEIVECIHVMEAEFARPQWVFGMCTYAFINASQIICTYSDKGIWRLAILDTANKRFQRLDTPYTEIKTIRATTDAIVFIGASPRESWTIVRFDLGKRRNEVFRRSSEVDFEGEYLSEAVTLEFPTEGGLTAYGFFYKPKSRDYSLSPHEKPPLIVMSHGGPTTAAASILNLMVQFWTTRGFAVLDVNYGGSTGFGKAYRERLNGNWGIVDVQDCINGAKHLVQAGHVDGNRLIIRGGSAGGFTTLAAITFHKTFKAGASYYGVSDIEVLAKETHKFESQYCTRLIGKYPEEKALYQARSPIHFTDQISCPLILLQGLDDKVVPPNQSESMFNALRGKGIPVSYVTFEGEDHGFRKSENIRRALDAELYFYAKVFRFEIPEPVERILIENLPAQ